MTSFRCVVARLLGMALLAVLLPACALSPNTGVGCAARVGSGAPAGGCGVGTGF
ncbi:MAG: hypothetical protein QM639_08145 [Rhodocyclaceae bacterium]